MADANNNGKGEATILKPTRPQRLGMINATLRKNREIRTIDHLILMVNLGMKDNFPDYEYEYEKHQPMFSGDLRELGIKTTRGKGFIFSDRAINRENVKEITDICEMAQVSTDDIIEMSYPLIIKIRGYGQALASVIKKMYKKEDYIIDILTLESSIVIYCKSKNALTKIQNDLTAMLNDEYHYEPE